MMPPECCICLKGFTPDKNSGLIYFKKRESDIEWDRLMEEKHMVGHPPYAAWFCKKHFRKANRLKHLYYTEALEVLKK